MTKAQARKRLAESASKVSAVFMDADSHLTDGELKKLLEIRMKLLNMAKRLK